MSELPNHGMGDLYFGSPADRQQSFAMKVLSRYRAGELVERAKADKLAEALIAFTKAIKHPAFKADSDPSVAQVRMSARAALAEYREGGE